MKSPRTHFNRLVLVIEEELNAAFAMHWLGDDRPPPDAQHLHGAAERIADGVDEVFHLEPR